MKLLLAIVLAVTAGIGVMTIPAQAHASQVFSVSWAFVPTRENGTALTLNEVAGYTLYYGQTAIPLNAQGQVVLPIPPDIASMEIAKDKTAIVTPAVNLPVRPQPYTVHFALVVRDTYGRVSKPGLASTTFTVKPESDPSAPATFKANVTCTGAQCTLVIVQ